MSDDIETACGLLDEFNDYWLARGLSAEELFSVLMSSAIVMAQTAEIEITKVHEALDAGWNCDQGVIDTWQKRKLD